MHDRELLQYLVLLFDADGAAVQQELTLAEFQSILSGSGALPQRAGESVRAAYVVVEPGLRVGALVFFLLPLDAAGAVPDSFNLSLEYLAEFAGIRDDLGIGPVRVASRGQCPVPWMALKLWEPPAGEDGPARTVQRMVRLNRRRLESNPAGLFPKSDPAQDLAGSRPQPEQAPAPSGPFPGGHRLAPSWSPGTSGVSAAARRILPDAVAQPVVQAASEPQPVPRENPVPVADPGQQEQIRKLRTEVQDLRAALRREIERNRRLQALLRGSF